MLDLALALLITCAVVGPHFLPLEGIVPATGIAIWSLALILRAILCVGAALFILVYVPQTPVFAAIASWCWELLTHHVEFSPHPLAHLAVILPALAIAASLLWAVGGLARAAIRLERYLRSRSLGSGPMNSTVLADSEPVIALTGFGRARLLVSRGALDLLDDEELEAGLAHEMGHSRRWHRVLVTSATLCAALSRALPGTKTALGRLRLELERDADAYAIDRTGDALALASAICKVGQGTFRGQVAMALGGTGEVSSRLDHLLGDVAPRGRVAQASARLCAVAMALVILGLVLTGPQWAAAAPPDGTQEVVCEEAS